MSPATKCATVAPSIDGNVDPTISLVAPCHLNGIEIAITPVRDGFTEGITFLDDAEGGSSWTISPGRRHLWVTFSGDRPTPAPESGFVSAGSIEEITATILGKTPA
jgi:hypothetical protein